MATSSPSGILRVRPFIIPAPPRTSVPGTRETEPRGKTREGTGTKSVDRRRRVGGETCLGYATAGLPELLRLVKELHDLLNFFLRLVNAGHVLEGGGLLLVVQKLGARL